MNGLNKVTLIGNFGKDPEYKDVNGADFVSFSLATDESYKDKNGQKIPKTEWHNITAWRGLAKMIAEWCGKGTKVYIEGKLQTRNYVDKENVTRYITEIVADKLLMLGGKPQNTARNEAKAPAAANATSGNHNAGYYANNPQPGEPGFFDEQDNDLPF